jgi:hypothetical protein
VTIDLSNPKLFSALQFTVGTQLGTGNPSPPGPSNTFTFSPPLSLPSIGTLTFTVMGVVAQKQAMVSPLILSGALLTPKLRWTAAGHRDRPERPGLDR